MTNKPGKAPYRKPAQPALLTSVDLSLNSGSIAAYGDLEGYASA